MGVIPFAEATHATGIEEDEDGDLVVTRPAHVTHAVGIEEDEDGDLVVARSYETHADESARCKRARTHCEESPIRGSPVQSFPSKISLRCQTSSSLANAGAQLWGSALVLADFLLAHPDVCLGRRVCELGAGCGLNSILAWKLGAAYVLCT